MALSIIYPEAGLGALAFLVAFIMFTYRLYKSGEGLGDFSVGLSYRDTFLMIISLVPLFAAINYLFTMFGFGVTTITGQTFSFIRYFEWSVTTPMMLMGLVMLTQQSRLLMRLIMFDVLMILGGFFGAAMSAPLRYVPLAISTIAFIGIVYILRGSGKEAVSDRPERLQRIYKQLVWLTIGVWSLYPLFWIISADGFGILPITETMIGFMILDLVSKIGYIAVVYWGFTRTDRNGFFDED